MTTDQQEFVLKCKAYLEKKWEKVTAAFEQGKPQDPLGKGHSLTHLIRDCLTSVTKTYHYVLPTQLLAKSVSPELGAHSLQVAYDAEEIDTCILSEFASGQNIYVSNFFDFALGIMILLGETGRVDFLDRVGKELDRVHSGIAHRKAWAELLKQA